MAKGSSKSIGEVRIDVTADPTSAKAGLDAIESKAKQTASGMGASTKKMKSGLADVGKAAEKANSVISKILIPVAIVGAISGIVAKWRELRKQAEAFRRELEAISKTAVATQQSLLASLQEPDAVRDLRTRILREQQQLEQAIISRAEAQVDGIQNLLGTVSTTIRQLQSDALGEGAAFTPGRIFEAAKKEIAKLESITNATLAAISRQEDQLTNERRQRARERITQINEEARLIEESLLAPQLRASRELSRIQEARDSQLRGGESQAERNAINRRVDAQVKAQQQVIRDLKEADRLARELDAKRVQDKAEAERKAAASIVTAATKAATAAFNRENQRLEQIMGRIAIAADRMAASVERIRRRTNP